jgi:hypothetical protein
MEINMGTTFETQELSASPYRYIVWSVGFLSPTDYLDEVAADLAQRGVRGAILFDLLLSNGNGYNRFVEAKFDGRAFDIGSFRVVQMDKAIRQVSLDFYRQHEDFLNASILPKTTQFFIRKNVCV